MAEDVHTAAQRMESRNVGSLVVVSDDGAPIGILTDRDLALRVIGQGRNPLETSVGDVMTHAPETVGGDLSIEEALSTMRRYAVRRLPVVDAEGRMCGLVSLDDILTRLGCDLAQVTTLIEETSPTSLAAT
jgi:CBS domain-containing protein